MLQKADIIGEFMCAGRNSRQNIQHSGVYLSGIGLSGHRIAFPEPHFFRNHRINPINLFLISVEQLQKTGLCSCRPLGAEKLQRALHILQISEVHDKLIQPEGGPLTQRCRLRRLKMCESEAGVVVFFLRGFCQHVYDVDQFFSDQLQRLAHNNNIRIVSHIAGGCAQMDNPLSLRALDAVGIDMGHDIMTDHFLPCPGHIIIDIGHMRLHLVNLFLRNVQPQLPLCFRQGNPEPSPCGELKILRKNVLHFPAGIALRQGTDIAVRIRHILSLPD